MKTLKDNYERTLAEAKSLNLDTDKIFEPIKNKSTTLKQRTVMLEQAIAEQNKILSEEIEQKITPKKTDTKETKPSGRVDNVSTAEGRK